MDARAIAHSQRGKHCRTGGSQTSGVLNLPAILKMVDRHGFAPCSPACKASDLLNDRTTQKFAGAGIEPARKRLMRPLPSHLAPLRLRKLARRPGAAPTPRSFGDSAAQAGARRVVELWFSKKWCGQSELHRHRLIGNQASCSWTMTAMGGAGRSARTAYDKKRTNTAALLSKTPTGFSRWIFRCFRHTSRKAFGL